MIDGKQKQRLADEVGLSVSFVHNILMRRDRCPAKRAEQMSLAYHKLFGVFVPPMEWVLNRESCSEVFGGEREGE